MYIGSWNAAIHLSFSEPFTVRDENGLFMIHYPLVRVVGIEPTLVRFRVPSVLPLHYTRDVLILYMRRTSSMIITAACLGVNLFLW